MSNEGAALNVVTPERVALSLPLAGIGSRALAYAVDAAILFGAMLAFYFAYSLIGPSVIELVEGLSTFFKVASALIFFAVLWGYWTVSELLMNGQSPGKRLLKIRVVRSDGSPVGFYESAVRNLVRPVDFLPALYMTGLVAMLFDAKHRRLGDLVAGTVIIREESVDLSHYQRLNNATGTLDAAGAALVNGFLARFDTLDATARRSLGEAVLSKVAPLLGTEQREAVLASETTLKSYLESQLGGQTRG